MMHSSSDYLKRTPTNTNWSIHRSILIIDSPWVSHFDFWFIFLLKPATQCTLLTSKSGVRRAQIKNALYIDTHLSAGWQFQTCSYKLCSVTPCLNSTEDGSNPGSLLQEGNYRDVWRRSKLQKKLKYRQMWADVETPAHWALLVWYMCWRYPDHFLPVHRRKCCPKIPSCKFSNLCVCTCELSRRELLQSLKKYLYPQ